MRILSLVRSRSIKTILPLLAVLFFLSCQKEVSSDLGGNNVVTPDLTTKVTSSVSGFVIDETNAPVENAVVSVGGNTASTDKYGYFNIKNVQVVKTAATVTVSKPGYFKGIKTYIADNNKSAFFRIKLLPKTPGGNIDAAAGGNVTLSSGMIIALPANGVVVAASNAAYTGPVTVSASWIDPVAADLNQVMPGDLRGINTEGAIKRLTSYGMVAVELTGSGGQLLQIAPGKTATLTFPIPSSISGSAPSSIPLWSFDESNGLWKEEGSATKTGNTYVGSVSHFSFWNCDVPNDYIQLDLTVHNSDGQPISFALVKVTDLGSTYNSAAYGYTDSSGFVRGAVPANTQLKVEVYSNYWCTSSNYSQTVTTTTANLSLGTIIINTSASSATVTGTVVDCSNNPVSNGNIIVHEGWQYTRYPLNADGTFSISRMLCSGTGTVSLIPEDAANAVQGSPVTQTLTTGANAVGTLQACGVSIAEFMTWAVDGGASTTLTPPVDSLGQYGSGSTNSFFISGSANAGGGTTFNSISFGVDATGIAVGSTQILQNIYVSQMNTQNLTITTNPVVNITEYGPVGGFIAANFTANVLDNTTSVSHTVVCSFRVRRVF